MQEHCSTAARVFVFVRKQVAIGFWLHRPTFIDFRYPTTSTTPPKPWYAVHYMRVVLNSFTRKRTSSLKKKLLSPNFSEPHVYLSRYIRRVSNRTSDKWATVIFLWWLHIQIRSFCIVFWSLLTFIGQFWHFHAHRSLSKPQIRPPSLQMKAVFRQGFSKTFAKLSRKINLYDRLERFSNSPIHSQNAQGRDIMRRTQDTKVMYLGLPSFLVYMLLDSGRDSIQIIYT